MTTAGKQSGLQARNCLTQVEFLRECVDDWEVYAFTIPAIRAFDRLPFEIAYRETEHFMATRRFLNGLEGMLEIVLNRDVYGD